MDEIWLFEMMVMLIICADEDKYASDVNG